MAADAVSVSEQLQSSLTLMNVTQDNTDHEHSWKGSDREKFTTHAKKSKFLFFVKSEEIKLIVVLLSICLSVFLVFIVFKTTEP